MAVTFNWHRGTRAALAEAIRDLDARLAAVELLAGGSVVSPDAVVGVVGLPSPWVQDALPTFTVAAAATVPTPTVRGAASRAASTVTATGGVPGVAVAAASVGVTPSRVAAAVAVPEATVTVP